MIKIGIIGQGFVGGATRQGLERHVETYTYDKFSKEKSNTTLEGVVTNSNVIFVCVPTPMDMTEGGSASTSIVEEVVSEIDEIAGEVGNNPTIVIKSTIPPGTTERINGTTSYCEVTFNPEFLTEANAVEDFKNQNRIIIGTCDGYDAADVVSLFSSVFPGVPIKVVNSREAEMCKYMINTFLSVKVSFANEIYDLCQDNDMDYDTVKNLAQLDTRLGSSHWMVPGPDGDRGFGGHCFPKDLNALCYVAAESGTQVDVLKAALHTNDRVRQERDWEAQEGRAVITGSGLNKPTAFRKLLEKIMG